MSNAANGRQPPLHLVDRAYENLEAAASAQGNCARSGQSIEEIEWQASRRPGGRITSELLSDGVLSLKRAGRRAIVARDGWGHTRLTPLEEAALVQANDRAGYRSRKRLVQGAVECLLQRRSERKGDPSPRSRPSRDNNPCPTTRRTVRACHRDRTSQAFDGQRGPYCETPADPRLPDPPHTGAREAPKVRE